MVNGKWCIYIAPLIQGALHRLCLSFTHSHTHSYTDGGGNHARHQPAHREQLGVQSLAQGLFDSNSGGARDRTGNLLGTLRVPMTATLPLSHSTLHSLFPCFIDTRPYPVEDMCYEIFAGYGVCTGRGIN